jgi:hypothetical protein
MSQEEGTLKTRAKSVPDAVQLAVCVGFRGTPTGLTRGRPQPPRFPTPQQALGAFNTNPLGGCPCAISTRLARGEDTVPLSQHC